MHTVEIKSTEKGSEASLHGRQSLHCLVQMRRLQQQTVLRWDSRKDRVSRQTRRPQRPRWALQSRSL